jgi:hypothetical protein
MRPIVRTAGLASLALALLLAARDSSAGSLLPIANAQPRVPQATVHGTGLLQFFETMSEPIVPATDQVNVELMTTTMTNNSTFTFQVELAANPNASSSGVYNGYDLHPALMEVFPARATPGWFAVISYRSSPARAIVNVFDGSANLITTTTYLGGDFHGVGFYVAGASGPLYSQDARNPGARAQLLFFRGTGLNTGSAWLAAEDQPLASGADGDYDDVTWFIESFVVCIRCDPTCS